MTNARAHTGVHTIKTEYNRSADSILRTHSAMVALLQHAYSLIDAAECRNLAQDARIASLEELAISDELTGLYNRRGFNMHFGRELDRAERHDTRGGLLILLDLDRFKQINDSYGHLAGDAALELFGLTLAQEIRKVDVAARLGGDEFAVLLTQTDPQPALRRARYLFEKLNALKLEWDGNIIPLATSIGAEVYTRGDDAAAIIAAADQELYANKSPGTRERFKYISGEARLRKEHTPGAPAPLM